MALQLYIISRELGNVCGNDGSEQEQDVSLHPKYRYRLESQGD